MTDSSITQRPATLTALTYQVADGVATVRFDRPERGNASDAATARDLHEVAARAAADPAVRAVLLCASGANFNVGGDITMFTAIPAAELPSALGRMLDDFNAALEILAGLDAPIVAAVRGAVAGGAVGLLGLADIVVAAEDAEFTLAYAGIGMSADGGTSWYLPRLLGMRRAQELFLLNRRFGAAEALDWGLVTTVVPGDELDGEAASIVTRLAAGPTRSLGEMRRLLRDSFATDLHTQLAAEQASIVRVAGSADVAEGLRAFTERRRPEFRGS